MKHILIFISILYFATCGNLSAKEIETIDKTEIDSVLIGESFELNDMLCHWEQVIFDEEIILKLKNSLTNEILWEWEYESLDYYMVNEILTNFFTNLIDFNFDGFKDFSIYSRGSMFRHMGFVIPCLNKSDF